jgi:hypothetical protein
MWCFVYTKGFFVEKLEADSFLNQSGDFISEKDHRDWEKPPGTTE